MLHLVATTLLFLALFVSGANAAIEITPMAGYRFGGGFEQEDGTSIDFRDGSSAAVAIDMDYQPNTLFTDQPDTQLELFWSHMEGELGDSGSAEHLDLDIDYIHIGGTAFYPQREFPIVPFAVGGLGATIFNPESDDIDPETRFSLSLGGGVRYFPFEHIGLRAEGRGYVTLFPDHGALFCENGNCKVFMEGDTLVQFEWLAGVIVRF